MDKLRAIQYFVAAADAGSMSAAARQLEVSVPAVQKQLGALERELGVLLLDRSALGVKLTSSGDAYLDCCRLLLAELDATEATLTRAALRPSGTLTVAIHAPLLHHILLPALPDFRVRYPEIQFDLRPVVSGTEADAASADVLLLHGWPEPPPDYVHRKLGMTRTLIVAAPQYWARRGAPQHPQALTGHDCLVLRNPMGTLLDLWEFRRGNDTAAVAVNGWLLSGAREVLLDAVLAGHGVGRFTEVTIRAQMRSGRLVSVLHDWEVLNGAPVNLLYRASARRTPRVRLFIDFTLELLRQYAAEGEALSQHGTPDRPAWHGRHFARASTVLRRRP